MSDTDKTPLLTEEQVWDVLGFANALNGQISGLTGVSGLFTPNLLNQNLQNLNNNPKIPNYDEVIKALQAAVTQADNLQAYTEKGQIRIHKNDMPKNENNLILWDKEKLKPEAVKAFENIVKLCRDKKIKFMVITMPVPKETLEKYQSNFEKADKFFSAFMEKQGVEYYNYNYQKIQEFDQSLNGFSDYEGHMYEDQSDIFSDELGKIVKDM